MTRILARTASRSVQSMVTLLRTAEGILNSEFRLTNSTLHIQHSTFRRVFAALVGFAHLFRQLDQLFNDGGGFDGAVLVLPDGFFQHVGEGTRLNEEFLLPEFALVVQQFAQRFHGNRVGLPIRQR